MENNLGTEPKAILKWHVKQNKGSDSFAALANNHGRVLATAKSDVDDLWMIEIHIDGVSTNQDRYLTIGDAMAAVEDMLKPFCRIEVNIG